MTPKASTNKKRFAPDVTKNPTTKITAVLLQFFDEVELIIIRKMSFWS
jgi:hypothetical protein